MCENDRTNVNLSKEGSLSDISCTFPKKNNEKNSNNSHQRNNNKNELSQMLLYKKASDILYNTNSNKYKYIQESKKLKKKNGYKNPSPKKIRSASCLSQLICDKIEKGDKSHTFYLNNPKSHNALYEEKMQEKKDINNINFNLLSSSYNCNGFSLLKSNGKLIHPYDNNNIKQNNNENLINCLSNNQNSRNFQMNNMNNIKSKTVEIEKNVFKSSSLPRKVNSKTITFVISSSNNQNTNKNSIINSNNNSNISNNINIDINNNTSTNNNSNNNNININNKSEQEDGINNNNKSEQGGGILKKKNSENKPHSKKISFKSAGSKDQGQDLSSEKINIKEQKEEILTGEKLYEFLKEKKLSSKQCSFYILTQSPTLRLCERMIFSRTSSEIKNLLPSDTMLRLNQILLNEKKKELNNKIKSLEKTLCNSFGASRTAEIALNFITSLHEEEFKEFPLDLVEDEEKKFYFAYIKILHLIFGEEYNDVKDNKLKNNLYQKINKKGHKNIREYLYILYIKQKNSLNAANNIEEINKITKEIPDMFDIHASLKMCKFISFTLYIVKEIINYANLFRTNCELKVRTQNFLDTVQEKINFYQTIMENKEKKK